MTTVTGLTADRMLAIEAASVVDGDVDASGNLILTQKGGTQINAGSVIGPKGDQGPVGSMLSVITAQPVLDVGVINQIRAGRQLSPADFGNIGLSAPLGLWNLSDLSDASGNGRALSNKGAVPFAAGINGVANTSAQFTGSVNQLLYIPDTGVNDPFRIKTGTIGCWFKSAKRATDQYLISKWLTPGNNRSWALIINGGTNAVNVVTSSDGANALFVTAGSDVADDRWHYAVAAYDGIMMRIYVDGVLEAETSNPAFPPAAGSPFNIGGCSGDGANPSAVACFARVDEAFITADVLNENQIRNLYCAKISHTLGVVPTRITLNIRRRRKGAVFVVADFSTQPIRLHNFSAGSLGDEGSGAVALTNNGSAVSVAGVDGSASNAMSFAGAQSLSSTDAGLPSGVAARSYGAWFKCAYPTETIMAWGTIATGDARLRVPATNSNGQIYSNNGADAIVGPFAADGSWHHVVMVEDNGAIDGVKRKMYFDGRLVGGSTVLNPITLAGANRFRIGAASDGSLPYVGLIDGVFVCDYAFTVAQVASLYAKGSQALTPSPKNAGDHIEAMDAASIFATFDTLHTQHTVDLMVAS